MKYVFFGTPSFSARFLQILLDHDVIPAAVVCNPDRPTGRKKIITAPPVKITAQGWSAAHPDQTIIILQPEKLDADFQETLRALAPDFFVVFAYNKIFRKEVLDIPEHGTVGVHPSLLPKYRGPSPFQTALLDGATETGVTLYLLDEGIDSGPIIAYSEKIKIAATDTFSSMAEKLADLGGKLFLATLPKLQKGKPVTTAQDETQATFTKKFTSADGFIEPADLAAAQAGDQEKSRIIDRKIRAFNPEPGAWTTKDGKRLKLLRTEIREGNLTLLETQQEGERAKTVG